MTARSVGRQDGRAGAERGGKLAAQEEETGKRAGALEELESRGFISEGGGGESVLHQRGDRVGGARGRQALQAKGIAYEGATEAESAALKTFAGSLAEFSPVAFQIQGYKNNRAIFTAIVTRLTQAIVGESTLDEALGRIDTDVKEALAAAK